MDQLLEIKDLHCHYGDASVVQGLSLTIQTGMLSCLLGPSGCGKTTVLRAIAGFEAVTGGSICLHGREVSRPGYTLPPEKRGLGMMFQDYALFPHLSVGDNIGFGLRHTGRKERSKTIERLLELVGMDGTAERYPHELSGGQQQRVSLARALAPAPPLLLLDEPFSNLDVDLRERLLSDVRDCLKKNGTAALFVTHDQHEAFMMGERVGVMNDGAILQWDTPFNLYHEPSDRFVADFIGQGRFISGRMVDSDSVETGLGIIKGNRAYNWPIGCRVDVLLRPDDVLIDQTSDVLSVVVERAFKGAETLYTLRLSKGIEVLSLMPSHSDFMVGDRVGVTVQADHLVLFQG